MVGDGDVIVLWFWAALGINRGVAGLLAVTWFVVEATGAAVAFGGFVFPD